MNTKPRIIGLIPLKFSSRRLPLKSIFPIDGKPSFIHVIEAVYEYVDKLYLSVEAGGYIDFITQTIDDYDIPVEKIYYRVPPSFINGPDGSVDAIVKDVMEMREKGDYLLCYPTNFRLTKSEIKTLVNLWKTTGKPHGYVDSEGIPIGASVFSKSNFVDGGHNPNEMVNLKSDIQPISTIEDFKQMLYS